MYLAKTELCIHLYGQKQKHIRPCGTVDKRIARFYDVELKPNFFISITFEVLEKRISEIKMNCNKNFFLDIYDFKPLIKLFKFPLVLELLIYYF